MSAFSTLFLPFEVSVGQPLSLHRTLAFPWHFIVFKALSLPLSYLILMTNRRGRQGRYLYPHFTDETSKAQRDGDLSQGDRIPQTLEDWMATSGSSYQVTLPCPIGIWGSWDEEAGVTGILDVGSVQRTRHVCSLSLSAVWRLNQGEIHIKTSPATMEQDEVRNKAGHGQILSPAPMLHEFQQRWLLLLLPRDSVQTWLWEQKNQMLHLMALAQKSLVHGDTVFQWPNFNSFWTYSNTLLISVHSLIPMSRAGFNAEFKLPQ